MYEQLIEIVKQAGAMIREAHEAEIPVYDKEGIANFVTKYDKDVQSFLIPEFPPASSGGEFPCGGRRDPSGTWRRLLFHYRSDRRYDQLYL